MSYIQLKEVSFTYPNGFTAIEDINITIQKGEFLAIVGQNGAGKTTAVKLLNGLLKPTMGDVIIGENNTKDYTVAQLSKNVGYVFQNPDDQIFNDTVYSEVEFGPKNLRFSEEKVKQSVKKAVERTNIKKFINENPYNLPYSTRKFVTIASVLAMEPDVIVLDEPTAGQDLYGINVLSNLLKVLKEEGKTVITITHDMEFVVNNFDRVVVMANKKIISDGNKRDVFWNHNDLKKGMLNQPYISRLAHRLNLPGNILNIDEMVDFLKKK